MNRNRILYGLLTIIVMGLGLASRRFISALPEFLGNYSGDTLWALMIFLGFAFVFNKKSTKTIGVMAITFSYLIEFTQLYHGQVIDTLRANPLIGLILGYGFLFSDLICYTIGIIIGICTDIIIKKYK